MIREIEAGATATETARKMGVSINTMQRWRAKFGGMSVSEAQEKRRLEDENRRLRKPTQIRASSLTELPSLKIA